MKILPQGLFDFFRRLESSLKLPTTGDESIVETESGVVWSEREKIKKTPVLMVLEGPDLWFPSVKEVESSLSRTYV